MEGQMEGATMEKKCGKGMGGCMHWTCCLMPTLGGILWVVGIISVVYAWMNMRVGNDATGWYWNALVFGVLALFAKGRKMRSCRSACGGAGNQACGTCK